ncbi:MAG: hypothetical protein WCK78_14450 [Paludibacter sp.]
MENEKKSDEVIKRTSLNERRKEFQEFESDFTKAFEEVKIWRQNAKPAPMTIDQCFQICINPVYFTFDIVNEELKNKYPFDDFNRLLIKTDLENFTEHLYIFGLFEKDKINVRKRNEAEFNSIIDHPSSVTLYNNQAQAISNALLFLLVHQDTDISIIFKSKGKYADSIKFDDNFLTSKIIEGLKRDYENFNLNEENLTFEEAEEEIKNLCDPKWIENYINQLLSDEENNVYYGRIKSYEDIEGFVDENMINEYAYDHETKREITVDYVKSLYGESKKRKPGAKPKNDTIASIAERLSYLIRLKSFLNQNEYTDISKYPLSNKDCRLIHDYLVFFNLIPNQKQKQNTTTTPENYIKALIKNFRKHRKLLRQENSVHFLINSYKRDGIYPIRDNGINYINFKS